AIRHRDNNLLSWRLKPRFLTWVEQNQEEAAAALAAGWDDSIDGGEAVERFAAVLPTKVVSGVGTRAGVASLLRMAVDVETNPVIRPATFQAAYELTGFEDAEPATERTTWDDGVRFCDTFIAKAAERGLEIRDRLDAQGLIWMVINYGPAPAWAPDEQAAYTAYRAGDRKSAGADRLSELVRAFRSETGYPAEGNSQRDQEREELAAALTPEALDALDLPTLRRLAGPAYGSPGPQPGFNKLLQSEESAERVAQWLRELLYGTEALETRISKALTGSGALPGVKEAIVTKALAVTDPARWFPNYVTQGEVGKRHVLELLGLPPSTSGLTRAQEMLDSNDRIRAVLEPHLGDDPWGMQEFTWWLMQTPPDEDAVGRLAREVTFPPEFVQKVLRLIHHRPQVVFYGPPGTGKTYFARALADYLARGGGTVEIVQFHPSYSYEDFVEGYRPRTVDGQLAYEIVDGPLKRIALKAAERKDVDHVLLIDEFNRALVSKVLGELYFLLEYRGTELRLQYSDTPFTLPPNLLILATMNTADRSIALVDAALRRRFHFIGFYPDQTPVQGLLRQFLRDNKLEGSLGWLPGVIDKANSMAVDRHVALGPSHFLDPKLTEEQVELIWEHSVMPYFEEQFLDEPDHLRRFELAAIRKALTKPAEGIPVSVDNEPPEESGANADAPTN
ncbi:MAG: AAA family ATPase, partial [Actinobacteria bacterium]|nr:AAA family ATPase [Actinomycetota bacterium]